MCVHGYVCARACACVCACDKVTLPSMTLPLAEPSACVSLCVLKIFCQAHSFDNNSDESRSSLRVQTALGARSAAKACQPIKTHKCF